VAPGEVAANASIHRSAEEILRPMLPFSPALRVVKPRVVQLEKAELLQRTSA
jgi:hypothetical protein